MHIKSLALLLVAMFFAQDIAAQSPVTLKPYTARYNVKYRGLSGGDLEFTLKNDSNGRYVYSSHVLPSFLGSFFISDQAEDTSLVQFDGSMVKPLKFRSEDGSKDTAKDIRYDFDWSKSSVNGHYKNGDFQLEVPTNIQDRLSIQLAASLAFGLTM